MLRASCLRKTAFPFDWIVSFDGEALIEILDRDFQDFLNPLYLKPFNQGPVPLLHTLYHLEFLHDGVWSKFQYRRSLKNFLPKYQRRIDRFRQLRHYQGTVYFIRMANIYSMTDPHRFYRFKENIEISDEYSVRLYHALKRYFPSTDFRLIVMNYSPIEIIQLEQTLHPDLIKVRIPSALPQLQKIEAYRNFFQLQIQEGN